MNYYKDKNNDLYVDPIVEKHTNLTELTETEFNSLLEEKNTLTEEQINTNTINTDKAYLTSTDWVVTKINEYAIQGEDTSDLLTKYADILTKRAEARTEINSLEASK